MKFQLFSALAVMSFSNASSLAGDLQIVAEGTVISIDGNGMTTGPFSSAQVGDPVRVSVDAVLPGSANVGSRWYSQDPQRTRLQIGSAEQEGGSSAHDIQVYDDFANFQCCPLVDYILTGFTLSSGVTGIFVVNDTDGSLFHTDDLSQLTGSYLLASGLGSNFLTLRDAFGSTNGLGVRLDILHIIDIEPIGTPYCSPAVPNSTGSPGRLSALGSRRIEAQRLQVQADSLGPFQLALLIAGQQTGFVANPGGSQGNLCLGGSIGRFTHAAKYADSAGSVQWDVDIRAVPTPTVPAMVVAGSTWHFQAWCRDDNPGPTSNFTDALTIQFQ